MVLFIIGLTNIPSSHQYCGSGGVEKSLLFALNHGFRTVTGAELFCYTRRPVRVGSAFMTALFLHGDENFLITTEKTGDAS